MLGKRLALVAAASALMTAAPLQAQLIGTSGGSANCFPFGCAQGTRYQQVYASSNWLSGPVSITAFSFFDNYYPGKSLVSGTFDFYLSTTSAAVNGLSTTFDSNLGSDNSLFAHYVLGGSAAPSVLTFTGNPFTYDPSLGNLLIDMRISGISGGGVYLDAMNGNAGGLFSRMHDFGGGYAGFGLVTEFNTAPITPAVLPLDAPISTVPEPSSIILLATGLLGLAVVLGRRRQVSNA